MQPMRALVALPPPGDKFQAFLNSHVLHASTQVNVLPTVVLEAQSSLELIGLITNKCVPFGKTARMAGTYRKQMQPIPTLPQVGLCYFSQNAKLRKPANVRRADYVGSFQVFNFAFTVEYFIESLSSDSETQFRRIFVNYSKNRGQFNWKSLISFCLLA